MSFVYIAPVFLRRRRRVPFALALGLALPMAHATVAFAQQSPGGGAPSTGGGGAGGGSQGGGGGAGQAGGAGMGQPGGGTQGGAGGGTTTTSSQTVQGPTTYQTYPGGVLPPPPGQTLGGGNVQFSSSKPITGANDRDTFDFQRGGRGEAMHGSEGGSFIIGEAGGGGAGGAGRGMPPPNSHQVRKGDTLWAICDFYFHNPYQWPRIWSYNPQIRNPHWIYPGDQVKLRGGGAAIAAGAGAGGPAAAGSPLVDRRRQVPPDTIFLRTQGFIDDDTNNWGEINGAAEDKMILSDFDEVYLRIAGNHDVKVGQELTVYRPVRSAGGGKLIEIQGTVKVDQWNPKEHIARARITESLDAIERGARVGPVQRRFEVVPPARNEKDVEATVLTSIHPHNFYGQNQVLFIDKGEDAGLKPGNRLFVIRKGDAWHSTQPARSSAKRIALEADSPAATENVPKPRDDNALPEEVVAELRVIQVRKNTALTIVTSSRREIETGEKAYARSGY